MRKNNNILLLFLFICFCSCKKGKESKQIINGNIKKTDTISNIVFPSQTHTINKHIESFFIKSNETILKTIKESKLIKMESPELLLQLFKTDSIKSGVVYFSEKKDFEIYEFVYNDLQAKNQFQHIKNQLLYQPSKKRDFYHDFLKRGVVFVLDKEKIILIMYEPFTQPKRNDVMNTFIKNYKDEFEEIISFVGLRNYEIIK